MTISETNEYSVKDACKKYFRKLNWCHIRNGRKTTTVRNRSILSKDGLLLPFLRAFALEVWPRVSERWIKHQRDPEVWEITHGIIILLGHNWFEDARRYLFSISCTAVFGLLCWYREKRNLYWKLGCCRGFNSFLSLKHSTERKYICFFVCLF